MCFLAFKDGNGIVLYCYQFNVLVIGGFGLEIELRGCGLETYLCHVVSMSNQDTQTPHNTIKVLHGKPRLCPDMTEKLLAGIFCHNSTT